MKDQELLETFFSTIHHFFPKFVRDLGKFLDPRHPSFITYPLPILLLEGLFLFLMKLESRRDIAFQFQEEPFWKNLWEWVARENPAWRERGEEVRRVPHGDTLNDLLTRLNPAWLGQFRTGLVRRLIRMRALEGDRLLGKYYRIVIDGTANVSFRARHCAECLTRKTGEDSQGNPLYVYYHPVLEAKLVTTVGLVLSVATEFIENEREPLSKQDCELKAFYRLAVKLKHAFPQLPICLMMDGLYAAGPVFDLCQHHQWKFLITFKEGSMPSVWQEFTSLKQCAPENALCQKTKEGNHQAYAWVSQLDYEARKLNILEVQEQSPSTGNKRFVWITNFGLQAGNVSILAEKGGRLRWKIENEGFNVQKNGGYGLEHAFSRNPIAIKNFYLLLQIAHTMSQLMEKGSLLKNPIAKVFGSLRNFGSALREAFTHCVFHFDSAFFARRIQIRFAFDSG